MLTGFGGGGGVTGQIFREIGQTWGGGGRVVNKSDFGDNRSDFGGVAGQTSCGGKC